MPGPDRLLIPGQTCWRVARADRLAVLIDAAAYFAAAKAAISQARRSVLMIGWDFDTRIKLDPRSDPGDWPDELGSFLSAVVRRNPDLEIRILKWDLSFVKMPFRGRWPMLVLDWLTDGRLSFRLDSNHPPGAAHHQKIIVIDDSLAFCGGIDMTADRWDTREHADTDPCRVRPSGRPYGPWHDSAILVDGAAAAMLGDLARERWHRATGESLPSQDRPHDCWPHGVSANFRTLDVALARTDPPHQGRPPVREVEALWLAAIASAKRLIYLESQYFASHRIAEALAERLSEPDGPEVVVINPHRADGWLEETVMGSARSVLLERLRAVDRHGRFRLYTPVTAQGSPIYVHSKVLIVDDRFLRVGSSNMNNRSLGLDTEADLAIEANPGEAGCEKVSQGIRAIRLDLVAEHLGLTAEMVQAAEDEAHALIPVIEKFRRKGSRTLEPLGPDYLTETERRLAETHLLDPDRPETVERKMERGASMFPEIRQALKAVAFTLGAGALSGFVFDLVRRRLNNR